MAKAKWHLEWKVLPHDPVRELAPNLREVTGAVPGMALTRRMTVIRLADGRLVIHNAMALDEGSMAALEAWGTPAFLVVPNTFHRLDAFVYTRRYPALQVLAAPLARKKVEAAVPVHGGPELIPPGLGLEGHVLAGTKVGEMAFIVDHGATKTLILNDAVFNQPHLPGFGGFVMRLLGSTGAPRVTRIMKVFGISDRAALRADLLRLADTPGLARLIVSHGDLLEVDVAATLRALALRDL